MTAAVTERTTIAPSAPAAHGRTAIDVQNLVKVFPAAGGVGTTRAVDNISIKIEAGELFFLLGPSGCGKTTLLRMIAGFIDPTGGHILFQEPAGTRDVTHLPPNKRNTGMVFQSYALWPHMTVAENVAFGLDVRSVKGAERTRRVMEALAAVKMEDYAPRKPNQLSGGQQQRVALARALVIRPSVLLLDEPLSNLDAKLRIELRSEIRRVCKESGITTVYVTHDQKEALSMADRMAVLKAGQVIQVGTPEALYRRPGSRFVAEFLGETNILDGRVTRVGSGSAQVSTSAGDLTSAALPETPLVQGQAVQVSIRHEAFMPAETPGGANHSNTLPAKFIETMYLGEVCQHTLELAGGERVKMAVINPATVRPTGGTSIRVDPNDVVLLPG